MNLSKIRPTAAMLFACMAAAAPACRASLGSGDSAFAVATHGGLVYVAGQTDGALPGQTNAGGSDAFVVAYDQNGNQVWARQFGSSAEDQALGAAADDSGVYVVGRTYGALPNAKFLGQVDAFIVKYDLNGNYLWTRQFGTPTYDRATAATSDGTYLYVGGSTSGALAGQTSSGAEDSFVVKCDQNGNFLWTKQFGTAGTDRAYGVAVDSTGVYAAGRTDGTFSGQVSQGGVDAFLVKLDTPSGNLLFSRQFGTSADDRGWAVATDLNGGVYPVGRVEAALPGKVYLGGMSDAFTAKYDDSGNQIWIDEFGTKSYDRAFAAASNGTAVFVAGVTSGNLGGNSLFPNEDAFVRGYDTSGNVLFTTQFGTSSPDVAYGVAFDATGIYVVGQTAGKLGQTHYSGVDAFLGKFDFSGNTIWIQQFGT